MNKALEGSLAAILIECRTGEITIEQGVKEIEQAYQYHTIDKAIEWCDEKIEFFNEVLECITENTSIDYYTTKAGLQAYTKMKQHLQSLLK